MKTKVVPLKWSSPGAGWSKGLKWNGTITIKRTMNTKAIIDFGSYTAAELTPIAQKICDKMTENAAVFANPTPTIAALQALVTDYAEKLTNRAGGSHADVLAFQAARAALEGALHEEGAYVNHVAKGDAEIVEKSGFPSWTTGGGAAPGPNPIPAAPQNVKLRNGDLPASVIARFKADRPNSFNVAQTTTTPTDEASWKTAAHGTGGKITITGLMPGTILWVRIATVGPGGQLGQWSDPAKIVVG